MTVRNLHKHLLYVSLTITSSLGWQSVPHAATAERLTARPANGVDTAQLAATIGLAPDDAFRTVGVAITTAKGEQKTREQQLFRGIPVYGHSIVATRDKSGKIISISGEILRSINLDLAAAPKLMSAMPLSGNDAIARLRTSEGDAPLDQKNLDATDKTQVADKAELYVYAPKDSAAHIAYLTSYFTDKAGKPRRPTGFVDAQSGEILEKWDGLTTDVNATGPGGNKKTGQYQFGSGSFPFLPATQSGNTCTMENAIATANNLKQQTSGGGVWSFACLNSSGDSINGGFGPINDAYEFGQQTYKTYMDWAGEPPLTFKLVLNVHYDSQYDNAFWNGSSMNFGDGASIFYPLVAVDVTGHEISHGFTEQHSNLQYSHQSGGMNEAYSDISGEAVENHYKGSNDFLVGADIMKNGTALRWMCSPSMDGKSIDNASKYTAALDVHYTSGVYNKAFCLLAKTQGWTTKKAWLAFELANKIYWTATETFDTGSCGVEQAADDLGFADSDVANAFNAVGVKCNEPSWQVVPGGGTTQLSDAVSIYKGKLYLFGIGINDHKHYVNVFDGTKWYGWNAVPGNGTTELSDTATVFKDKLYLFSIGTNDHKHYVNAFDGSKWSGWSAVPGDGTTQLPDASVVYKGKLYLFGIGINDHEHYVNTFDGSRWSGWGAMPGGGTTATSDAAVVFGDKLYLFGIGINDHAHYVNVFDGNAWAGWNALPGGGTTNRADTAAVFKDKLYLFGVGIGDHRHYMNVYDGSAWGGWSSLPGNRTTELGDAAAVFQNSLYLFSIGIADHFHYYMKVE